MLNLSAAAKLEKNRVSQDSAWLTLLELVLNESESIRIVANTEDITWNGQTWTAYPFEIDTVQQTKNEIPNIPVKLSNVTGVLERIVEQYNGFTDHEVILRVINSKYSSNTIPELEEHFTVNSVSTDSEFAVFNLGGAQAIVTRFPFRRVSKDWCQYRYKDPECAATSPLTTCAKTLKECRERNNSVRFGGTPSMTLGGIMSSNV
jgi:phage-related protein